MALVDVLVVVLLTLFGYVTTLFVVGLFLRRNDIADVAWGPGVLLAGLTAVLVSGARDIPVLIVLGCVSLWAVRLGVRIFLRNRKKGEDYRYRAWRESWGRWFFVRSYLQVYLLQGFLMAVVGYPLIHLAVFGTGEYAWAFLIVGGAVWLSGFYFEVVGDVELDRFMRLPENKGKLLTTGLWRYSRHPNYFGEVTMWWGVWLMILSTPFGVVALVSPITITLLILRVSGIPMLEVKLREHPEWAAYAERTSAFIPWPPRTIM